ncbi:hypothetical protein [Polynucleobacter sp. P1-05-14]|uniref:hypothetical protein n=1 Tax=Polynucleobacter sp. P1-05-14 TaxID=1819732 RepID=UPI001C0BE8C2|nr:hypothetical protein [Polynucleobacter sp. P1-05-14]MBU3548041.1 hypothetical protein [Polynucleobacter sp. P1-05-14]
MIFKKLISTLAFAITACVCSVSAYAIPTTTYYDFSATGTVSNNTLTPPGSNYDFSFLLSTADGQNLNFVSGTVGGVAVTPTTSNNIGTLSGSSLNTIALSFYSGLTSPVSGLLVTKSAPIPITTSVTVQEYFTNTGGASRSQDTNSYLFQVAGAPEIDGSLAPKVGFLLGCLFLMFGRKKSAPSELATA